MRHEVDLGQLRVRHEAVGLCSAIRSTASVSCLDQNHDLLVTKDKLLSHDIWVGRGASLQIVLNVNWDPYLNPTISQDALRQHVFDILGNAPVGWYSLLLLTKLTTSRCGPN